MQQKGIILVSLLEAISSVANEAGYSVGSTGIGSTDVTTKQLLAIAQRLINEMSIAYPWPKLYASGSVTLAAGTASYALPAAFSYYHYDSFWNSSTRWRVLGPMSEQEYALIRGYGFNTTIYQRFQLRGVTNSELLISPTPTSSGDIIIFEYIADRPVRPMTWDATTIFAVNAYCFYNGNYYQTTSGGSGGSAPVHTSGTTGLWTYYNGAYNQFLADTDEPILSQRVLEQGMLERFGGIHGLAVTELFNDQLNEEFSKQIPGKILYSGDYGGRYIYAQSGVAVFGGWI